jgi:hypothetical protein
MQKQVSVTVGYQFGNAPRMLTLMGVRGKGKKLFPIYEHFFLLKRQKADYRRKKPKITILSLMRTHIEKEAGEVGMGV